MKGKVIRTEDGINQGVEYGTGYHLDNSYNHWVSVTVKDKQGKEYNVDVTSNVYNYLKCKKLSSKMIGKISDGLRGVTINFYYNQMENMYFLDGDLSDYM